MKYLLTTLTAALLGNAGFHLAERLRWKRWQERLVVLLGAVVAAAGICASAWI